MQFKCDCRTLIDQNCSSHPLKTIDIEHKLFWSSLFVGHAITSHAEVKLFVYHFIFFIYIYIWRRNLLAYEKGSPYENESGF